MCGDDPGKVRGPARAGDDHFEAAGDRVRRVRRGIGWRAVRRHDACLMRDAEAGQDLGSLTHRVPVGLASHDDGNERRGV